MNLVFSTSSQSRETLKAEIYVVFRNSILDSVMILRPNAKDWGLHKDLDEPEHGSRISCLRWMLANHHSAVSVLCFPFWNIELTPAFCRALVQQKHLQSFGFFVFLPNIPTDWLLSWWCRSSTITCWARRQSWSSSDGFWPRKKRATPVYHPVWGTGKSSFGLPTRVSQTGKIVLVV